MKSWAFLGIFIGGSLGGWLGAVMDHGNYFGGWSILLSTIGSAAGLWVGWKVHRYLY